MFKWSHNRAWLEAGQAIEGGLCKRKGSRRQTLANSEGSNALKYHTIHVFGREKFKSVRAWAITYNLYCIDAVPGVDVKEDRDDEATVKHTIFMPREGGGVELVEYELVLRQSHERRGPAARSLQGLEFIKMGWHSSKVGDAMLPT